MSTVKMVYSIPNPCGRNPVLENLVFVIDLIENYQFGYCWLVLSKLKYNTIAMVVVVIIYAYSIIISTVLFTGIQDNIGQIIVQIIGLKMR